MGKIRVKTFGEEVSDQEKEQKKREKEAKKAAKKAVKTSEEKSEEKKETVDTPKNKIAEKTATVTVKKEEAKETKTEKKAKFRKEKKAIGKKYKANLGLIKKDRQYALKEAIELLKSMTKSKFDETVELHINVKEKGTSGQVSLPHGTGKQIRIKVADEALIDAVLKGKIDFDILVAEPQMMPKLARVAKILGPKGLMPNPKAGTISPKPQEVVEKLSKGQVNYKTETEAPIIHLCVGKLSFENKQLTENINTVLSSVGQARITSATLKSTMSPGIKLQI